MSDPYQAPRSGHPPPGDAAPAPLASDPRILRFIADLYAPLAHPARPRGSGAPGDEDRRRHEQQELARARAAAQRAFNFRATPAEREAAAMMLSARAI